MRAPGNRLTGSRGGQTWSVKIRPQFSMFILPSGYGRTSWTAYEPPPEMDTKCI